MIMSVRGNLFRSKVGGLEFMNSCAVASPQ
jgi:hypothetical protein